MRFTKYYLILHLLICCYNVYAQCDCDRNICSEIYRFVFPVTRHETLLCGYSEDSTSKQHPPASFLLLIVQQKTHYCFLELCKIAKFKKTTVRHYQLLKQKIPNPGEIILRNICLPRVSII
jgi:hypothetical protein